jgi:glycosyltransferase involved in cell wall biosynthesis
MAAQVTHEAPPCVSVVIPVFNGARSLEELVARLSQVAAETNIVEIVLVDDCSRDDSWLVIQKIAEKNPSVTGVALARNAGQHPALLAGIAHTTGDVIVTMDDDLQHRPEDIPVLLASLTVGVDLVYGRSTVEEHTHFRNLTSRISKRLIAAAAGSDAAELASGFRCFRATHRDILVEPRGPYVSVDVVLSWVTRQVVGAPVVMDPRRYGSSNYTVGRLMRHALNMLFGFSTAPLRFVSYVGAVLSLVGLGLLVFVLVNALATSEGVPGFAFVASMVALFSGFQIAALGILGEYMARLYADALQRPAYVVRSMATASREAS